MGLLQVARLFAAREILSHAAARAARARTVGFNRWMVEKCARVASIPNAGRLLEPPFVNEDKALREMVATLRPGALWSSALGVSPSSLQYSIERARIPEYLASANETRSRWVLDYSNWDTIDVDVPGSLSEGSATGDFVSHASARQKYPLTLPFHRTFYAADSVRLKGESYLESHYPLYIDDMRW